ncbi:MAG TPA: sigma 54-interacting transcriptional regulator [Labilithrix sp.]|jgi:DNA-binding NtrC family response regulator|nr:sigma 54-interacting transcriptional regulator [Labilithrix sp.]
MSSTLADTPRDDLSSRAVSAHIHASLYVVLEGERVLEGGLRASLANVDEVRFARGDARAWSVNVSARRALLTVPDRAMSSRHARLVRQSTGWLLEDAGSTNGTFVEGSRVPRAHLTHDTVVTLGSTVFLVRPEEPAAEETATFVDAVSLHGRPRGTRTLTPVIEQQMTRLVRVADSSLSILLLGESGVGKEVLARGIHELSRNGPFVGVNCGALAPTLVESQLFGHAKGAFSGAVRDEPGLVRASSGGTLFLDEIGELPPAAQATLLRVLQEREVLPVGSTKAVPVDLRVVAATLKPIDQSPTFRRDLYARVAAYVQRLPPLRARRGDVGLLIADLLPRIAPERAATLRFGADLATALVRHAWPFNVRELEHVLSVALATRQDQVLKLEDVGDALEPPAEEAFAPSPPSDDGEPKARRPRRLSEEERKLKEGLVEELTRARGNVAEVARVMGRTRMQIHRWMKRFTIDPDTFRA